MTGSVDGGSRLCFEPERAGEELGAAADGNVLAVLTDSTVDEWRRRWGREVDRDYAQMGVVETYGLARSAAAEPRTTLVEDDLAVTSLARADDLAPLRRVVGQFLDGWRDRAADTVVYVEDLAPLVESASVGDVADLLDWLDDRAAGADVDVLAALDAETTSPRTAVRLRETATATVGRPIPEPGALAAVERLRAEDPTTFGYLRRHWAEAIRAIERSDRSCPQAKQLHGSLPSPSTSPRTLGAALSGLCRLDAVDLWGDTVGPNRYDLTSYDPDRAAAVGLAVASIEE